MSRNYWSEMSCDRVVGVRRALFCSCMKVDVYQTNKEGTYLFLPRGAPFSSVPEPVRDSAKLQHFIDTMELATDAVGSNPSEIQTDLEKQGYSMHQAQFKNQGAEGRMGSMDPYPRRVRFTACSGVPPRTQCPFGGRSPSPKRLTTLASVASKNMGAGIHRIRRCPTLLTRTIVALMSGEGIVAMLRAAISHKIPVGYEDEAGFHIGMKMPPGLSNSKPK